MADYPITAVVRRTVLSGSAGTGPYAFNFPVLTQTDLDVYKDTTKLTLTTNYTVSVGSAGTGTVTLGVAASASNTITIVGARAVQRTTDFVTAGDLLASSLNTELDSQTIFAQQTSEDADRAIKAPVTDPTSIDMTLPSKDNRKGKYLAFNSTSGDPEAGASSDDVTTLAAITTDIATLADIQDGTVATNAITVSSANSTNIGTVAGISANVTTVAGISSAVTAVAGDATDIGTVAGIASNVTSVAGIASNVTSVAGNATNVNKVAAIDSDVTAVAAIDSDVTTVAGISGDVSAVAAQVIGYDFSTTTAMADPGSGNVRFNNGTLASVSQIALDDLDKNGVDQSAFIALFDDSTNTVKGTLVFRTAGGDVATFNITGLTDNTGWNQIAVTHVASSGTFSNGEDTFIGFTRAGDKGADGEGSGDVTGPGSATDNTVARYNSTTGKLLQGSGVTIDDSNNVGAASLTLTTDLAVAHGGTGSSSASAARAALGAAALGANSDITSLTGLTTDLTVAQGGTGASTFAANGILYGAGTGAVAATAVGTSAQVLTSNGSGVAPTFQDAGGGGRTIAVEQKALGYYASSSINGDVLPTGWSITHTLAASGNALLVQGFARGYNPNCSGNVYTMIKLFQDGSLLTESSAPDSGSIEYVAASYFSSQNFMNPMYIETLIKPGDTSSHTYQLYIYGNAGAQGSPNTSWGNAFMRITEIDGSICTVA